MLAVELTCRQCQWRTVCGDIELARRLRTLGLLRRAPDPPDELVLELLKANGSRLTCDACGEAGMLIDTNPASTNDDEWQVAVVCEVCRKPIPDERLDVFPDARRCVACQNAEDEGRGPVEPDYCPKCGAVMELRVSRVGVTRYKQVCTGQPACRL